MVWDFLGNVEIRKGVEVQLEVLSWEKKALGLECYLEREK